MNEKSTFSARLRSCMERMHYTQRAIANQVGVTQPAVAKWLAGDTKKVQADILFKLADLFRVHPRWLSDGQGEAFLDPNEDWLTAETLEEAEKKAKHRDASDEDAAPAREKKPRGRPKNPEYTMQLDFQSETGKPKNAKKSASKKKAALEESDAREEIPASPEKAETGRPDYRTAEGEVYARIPAYRITRGKTESVPLLVPCPDVPDAVIPKSLLSSRPGRCYLQFTVNSDTMVPAICPNDSVIVETTPDPDFQYGAVYVLYWQNQTTLGRVLRNPDGSVTLQYDNPAYEQRQLSEELFDQTVYVVGQVVLRTGSHFICSRPARS